MDVGHLPELAEGVLSLGWHIAIWTDLREHLDWLLGAVARCPTAVVFDHFAYLPPTCRQRIRRCVSCSPWCAAEPPGSRWAVLSVMALRTLPRREILFPPPSRGNDAPDTPHTTEMLVNDQASNRRAYGRGLVVTVAGDSPHELEQAALRQATGFFGPDAELDINTTYTAHPARGSADSQGKVYRARITVREIAPAGTLTGSRLRKTLRLGPLHLHLKQRGFSS